MRVWVLSLALSLLVPVVPVFAGELDNEERVKNAQRHAVNLPQTVVVRKSKLDGVVSVYHSRQRLAPQSSFSPRDFKYIPMKTTDRFKNELDGDSSKSGWYFYWYAYSYSQPAYFYYGFNYYYRPYYTVYYYPYYYTYYCWC